MSIHNVRYFIQKFGGIPEDKWCVDTYVAGDARCALGHCGYRSCDNPDGAMQTEEGLALKALFVSPKVFNNSITLINDGKHQDYRQQTPKQRVLAALYDLSKTLIC